MQDGELEQVAHYAYDAWGNMQILQDRNSIATLNPFRYRSYYFDEETKLYYLQTRYYDPELGRFISADSIEYLDPETLGGLNLYAYCGNNPVMAVDPNGTVWWNPKTWNWKKVGDWFVNAGRWINNKIIQPTITFFKENWDLILAGALFIMAIAATVGAFITKGPSVLISMGAGALIGTSYGALNSHLMGDDPLQGAITGLVVGTFGGASGLAGGFAAAAMSIIMDRVNGKKPGWDTIGRAVESGLVVGLLSVGANAASGSVAKDQAAFVVWIVNLAFSSLATLISNVYDMVEDALREIYGR